MLRRGMLTPCAAFSENFRRRRKISGRRPNSPRLRRKVTAGSARQNNLKNIDVSFPLGKFICVTGVSGSGKSSLVNEILYKGAARITNRTLEEAGDHDRIDGIENIDKVIDIDQSPIGRTAPPSRKLAMWR